MTGYGRAAATARGHSVVAEIRTVNHRFLELKLRGVGLSGALEDQISAKVRASFERGSVLVSVVVRPGEGGTSRLDRARAHQVFRDLTALAAELGLPPPGLAELLASPAVLSAEPSVELLEESAVLALIEQALAEAAAMRRTEGASLARELEARLGKLAALTAELQAQADLAAPVLAERLHERARKLLAQLSSSGQAGLAAPSPASPPATGQPAEPPAAAPPSLDAVRLMQEVALLVDRADITEELVRLASHLEQARGLLTASGALGRRLEFLLQEIGRELNTIGAKAWSSAISTRIVEAKSELEKLREQAQNVE